MIKGNDYMTVHHGGKIGKAGRALRKNSNTSSTKSRAGKVLRIHQERRH